MSSSQFGRAPYNCSYAASRPGVSRCGSTVASTTTTDEDKPAASAALATWCRFVDVSGQISWHNVRKSASTTVFPRSDARDTVCPC